jgi:opacity protein-like surface antigen
MKKLLALLVVLLLATGAFAQDINISAGATVNYIFWDAGALDAAPPNDVEENWSFISIGAFVDVTYAMFSVSYAFSLGGPNVILSVDGTKDDAASEANTTNAEKYAAGYLVITALGKYPIDVGGVTIFPMLGVEYQLNLSLTDDGNDQKDGFTDDQNASLNDFYILGGLGADFNVAENIYIRAMVLYAYNLTPDTPFTAGGDFTEWGWNIKGGISVGFMF